MTKQVEKDNAVFGSLADAARFAKVSRPTFTREVLPHIPHRRARRRILITRATLIRWLEGED